MSVKYRKVVNNRKGSKTQGKIYGRAVVSDTIYTKKLCQNIRDRCTLTEPDVVAVVSALVTEVTAQLALGNRVVLRGYSHSPPSGTVECYLRNFSKKLKVKQKIKN